MTRVSVKAIVLGLVVNFLVGGALAVVTYIAFPAVRAGAKAAVAGHPTPALLVTAMLTGYPALALGGFVAGRIARRGYVLNGALVGVVSLVIGVAIGTDLPAWFNITSALLAVPVATWGALLAKSRESAHPFAAGA